MVEIEDLLNYTHAMTDNEDRYSKKRRFTYVNRIQNIVLDVYAKVRNYRDKELPGHIRRDLLYSIRMDLNALLVLIELSLQMNFIDSRQCKIWVGKVTTLKEVLKI